MNGQGEFLWTWTRRLLGVLVILTVLFLLVTDREVPGTLIVIGGGLVGAEFLPWAAKDKGEAGAR